MPKELVSVVVVTYNSEDTIFETIESIANQSYENIEIVVSDDCSQDRTIEIVRDYANNKTNIQIITSDHNTGVAANANRGIKNAHGKFIKLIAGDDVLERDAIEQYHAAFVDEKTIIIGDFECFGKNQEAINRIEKYYEDRAGFFKLNNKKQFDYLIKDNPICAPAAGLIPRDLYETVGYYDENYKFLEDYPYWLKCSMNGIRFQFLDKKVVKYRVSEGSLTGKKKGKAFYCARDFFFDTRLKLLIRRGHFITAFCYTMFYLI